MQFLRGRRPRLRLGQIRLGDGGDWTSTWRLSAGGGGGVEGV